tara:strand:- start:18 stop:557 length:540 start_codon:yes stop_codon:yes gene_type:complete
MNALLENLKKVQGFINEIGMGASFLALPRPKTQLLSYEPAEKHLPEAIYDKIIEEIEIVEVSRDLFESGYYNLSVSEAFKALDIFIKKKVGETEASGAKLVQRVFSVGDPELVWSDRKTLSEKDHHRGYHLLFQGGFTGIRNPTTHELDWITEPEDALDALMLAQHLLRKAKLAAPPKD